MEGDLKSKPALRYVPLKGNVAKNDLKIELPKSIISLRHIRIYDHVQQNLNVIHHSTIPAVCHYQEQARKLKIFPRPNQH